MLKFEKIRRLKVNARGTIGQAVGLPYVGAWSIRLALSVSTGARNGVLATVRLEHGDPTRREDDGRVAPSHSILVGT